MSETNTDATTEELEGYGWRARAEKAERERDEGRAALGIAEMQILHDQKQIERVKALPARWMALDDDGNYAIGIAADELEAALKLDND